MPWGKFKGQPIEDVPSSYLLFVLEKCESASYYLKEECKKQLAERLEIEPDHTQPVKLDWFKKWFLEASIAAHPDQGGSARLMKHLLNLRERMQEEGLL